MTIGSRWVDTDIVVWTLILVVPGAQNSILLQRDGAKDCNDRRSIALATFQDRYWPAGTERPTRTCNRHFNCDEIDAQRVAQGRQKPEHCHAEDCEECFGN